MSYHFFAEMDKGEVKNILNMPPCSLLFSLTASASWARTSFSSSPSRVLESYSLFFSSLTHISTRSPAACCLLASCSPAWATFSFSLSCPNGSVNGNTVVLILLEHDYTFSDGEKHYQAMPPWISPIWR